MRSTRDAVLGPSAALDATVCASSTPTRNGPRRRRAAQAPSSAPIAVSESPTRRDQVVELDAGIEDRALLAEPREVTAVALLGRSYRIGSAARIASGAAQVFGRVLLDAPEQVEALVRDLADERLVDQRLQQL